MNPLLKPQFLNSSTVNKDCNANLIANIYYHTAMYESYPLTFRLEKLGNSEEEKLARASYSTFLPLLPPPYLIFSSYGASVRHLARRRRRCRWKNARCKKESVNKNSWVSAAFQKRFEHGSKFPPRFSEQFL